MSENVEPNTNAPESIECKDLIDVLYEYVDGDCDADLRQQLQAHIQACPSCIEKLGVEREIRELLRARCAQAAPSELRHRITTQLRVVYRRTS